jgi:hypothetical protein
MVKFFATNISSEEIATGNFLKFVEKVKSKLGSKAAHREVTQLEGTCVLREDGEAYGHNFDGKNEPLSLENTRCWNEIYRTTAT